MNLGKTGLRFMAMTGTRGKNSGTVIAVSAPMSGIKVCAGTLWPSPAPSSLFSGGADDAPSSFPPPSPEPCSPLPPVRVLKYRVWMNGCWLFTIEEDEETSIRDEDGNNLFLEYWVKYKRKGFPDSVVFWERRQFFAFVAYCLDKRWHRSVFEVAADGWWKSLPCTDESEWDFTHFKHLLTLCKSLSLIWDDVQHPSFPRFRSEDTELMCFVTHVFLQRNKAAMSFFLHKLHKVACRASPKLKRTK